MSGVLDFFRKKPGQKSLFDVFKTEAKSQLPALPAPSEKPGLPALPKEEKKSLFAFMDPSAPPPPKSELKKKVLSFLNVLKPTELPKAQDAPPPPPQPMAPWQEMFPAQEEPAPSGMFEQMMKVEPPPPPPPKYIFFSPSAPAERQPIRAHGLPTPSTSPVMEWTLPTVEQLAAHFQATNDLPAIWNAIREARAHPDFKKDQLIYSWQGQPMVIPLDPIVYQEFYTDFSNFYGIPWGVISMYLDVPKEHEKAGKDALWNNVLSPLNSMIPDVFEMLKPGDIPGFFNVTFTEPSGQYWLYYIEPKLTTDAPGGST